VIKQNNPNPTFCTIKSGKVYKQNHLGPVKDIPENIVKEYEKENEIKINNILEKAVRDIEEKS
jgi:hypothetical protein